jgi:putative Mn2+ efflux pump MntP
MPSLVRLLILGVVVGSNNFAAALALGSLGQSRRKWRVVATFGAFETVFPLLGIWIGHEASERISGAAGWIGIGLLAALGGVGRSFPPLAVATPATIWRGGWSPGGGCSCWPPGSV